MRKIFLFAVLSLFSVHAFSQQAYNGSASIYREALYFYESGEYGKALKRADDAIVYKKAKTEEEAELLRNSLASRQVSAAGDRIEGVLAVLKERGELDCVDIINFYTEKKGLDFFGDSITRMASYIESQSAYPEALKLIGDIFKLEGEYSVAEEYYTRALSHSDMLDIPDERFEILYMLAELSRFQGDYDKMEVRLLNIVGSEKSMPGKSFVRAMHNTIAQNKSDSLVKFFELFRAEGYYSLNACCQLSEYYLERGQLDKALDYSSLSVITGFTKIYNILKKRNLDYEFSDLTSYFEEVSHNPDVIRWGTDKNVWKEFYLFSKICLEAGYNVFANELLVSIVKGMPVPYWQESAVLLLDTIDGEF